jgi:hypothetical protein
MPTAESLQFEYLVKPPEAIPMDTYHVLFANGIHFTL